MSINYPVETSLPQMEISLSVRYVVKKDSFFYLFYFYLSKKDILLPALENFVESSHCEPISQKFRFAGINSKIRVKT